MLGRVATVAVLAAEGLWRLGAWVKRNTVVGDPEPGYRWQDSDGDWGIERGSPPRDGTHPRKPGKWPDVDRPPPRV